MASGPITSWLTDEEKVETVTDFIFLGSKITVAGNYSCEIKTLALWKKIFDKPRQRKWQPTPVLLPGESQGRGSLVGCRIWGRTESDMTEGT